MRPEAVASVVGAGWRLPCWTRAFMHIINDYSERHDTHGI